MTRGGVGWHSVCNVGSASNISRPDVWMQGMFDQTTLDYQLLLLDLADATIGATPLCAGDRHEVCVRALIDAKAVRLFCFRLSLPEDFGVSLALLEHIQKWQSIVGSSR